MQYLQRFVFSLHFSRAKENLCHQGTKMYGKYGKSCREMVAKNGRFLAKMGGLESLDDPCYTRQFSGNLYQNSIAKQVAEKIMQCKCAGP